MSPGGAQPGIGERASGPRCQRSLGQVPAETWCRNTSAPPSTHGAPSWHLISESRNHGRQACPADPVLLAHHTGSGGRGLGWLFCRIPRCPLAPSFWPHPSQHALLPQQPARSRRCFCVCFGSELLVSCVCVIKTGREDGNNQTNRGVLPISGRAWGHGAPWREGEAVLSSWPSTARPALSSSGKALLPCPPPAAFPGG